MMIRTGKGGRYRYYACAGHRLKGRSACSNSVAIPEGQLNPLVVNALADHLLTPERVPVLLREAYKQRTKSVAGNAQRGSALRVQLRETDGQVRRLYAALAESTVSDWPMFRDTLNALEAKRDETVRLLSLLDVETPHLRHAFSKAQSRAVTTALKRGLLEAPPPLQRRYVHGLVSEIVVDREKAVISGPKASPAAAITAGAHNGEVRTFVREWRTGQDETANWTMIVVRPRLAGVPAKSVWIGTVPK
jgi:site-specific DNA recombinase